MEIIVMFRVYSVFHKWMDASTYCNAKSPDLDFPLEQHICLDFTMQACKQLKTKTMQINAHLYKNKQIKCLLGGEMYINMSVIGNK